MSNALPALDPVPPPADEDLVADAELVVAAVRRMETALRGREAAPASERLRQHLGEMAEAVARARAAIKPDSESSGKEAAKLVAVAALLCELEWRLDAMVDVVEAKLSAPAPAEAEDTAAAEDAPPSAEVIPMRSSLDTIRAVDAGWSPLAERVPTVPRVVSPLGAVAPSPAANTVEPAAKPAVKAEEPPTVTILHAMVEALAASAAASAPGHAAQTIEDVWPDWEPTEPEAASEPVAVEPAAVAQPVDEPRDPPDFDLIPELDLMSSFEQMQSVPHFPAEPGAAVIFEREPEAAIETAPPSPPALTPVADEPSAALPPGVQEAVARLPAPEWGLVIAREESVILTSELVPAPTPQEPQLSAPAVMPETNEAELPSPAPRYPVAPSAPVSLTTPAGSYDPLRPVRLMSDEERIALFS